MKIFYNTKTGQVIGTVDGFNDVETKGIRITSSGIPDEDIAEEVIGLGHPKEKLARRLMNPHDELGVQFLKAGKKGIEEMTGTEKAVVKTRLKKEAEEIEQRRQAPPRDKLKELQQKVEELQSDIEKLKKPRPDNK